MDGIIEEYNRFVVGKMNVNDDGDFLDFSGVKSVNFLRESMGIQRSFLMTYGDELLPPIYNDNSLVVDGPDEIRDLHVFINPGDVVFDIGANLGLFCCYAAHKGCRVYAFDPGEICVEYLNKQRELYPAIQVVPIGLSNQQGKKSLFETDASIYSSMNPSRDENILGRVIQERDVEVDTLDHFVETNGITRIDYLKADIEGEERNMLLGATKVLKELKPKLAICTYHYPDDPEVLEKIIREANPDYIVQHSWQRLYAYVP